MAAQRDAYQVLQVDPAASDVVIRAAYRALAALYHPDRDPSPHGTRRMAELNDAYAKVSTPERRAAYERERKAGVVAIPVAAAAERRTGRADAGASNRDPTLDFGRYSGWTIRQIARHDPDYLRWLARHSSGLRFRRPIEEVLRDSPGTTVRTQRNRQTPRRS